MNQIQNLSLLARNYYVGNYGYANLNGNWINKEQNRPILDFIQHLSSEIGYELYLAGGAVRDLLYKNPSAEYCIPKDLDLYIPNIKEEEKLNIAESIRGKLKNQTAFQVTTRHIPYVNTVTNQLNPISLALELIPLQEKYNKMTIQLMLSNLSISETLVNFDWLQCAYAIPLTYKDIYVYRPSSQFLMDNKIEYAPKNNSYYRSNVLESSLVLMNFHDPLKTLKRGLYMAQRNTLTLQKKDINFLMTSYLLNQEKYNENIRFT